MIAPSNGATGSGSSSPTSRNPSCATGTSNPSGSTPPAATLVPVELPASVPIGGSYDARLHFNGTGAVEVRFTLHEPVTTLERFVQTAQGNDLGVVTDSPICEQIADMPVRPHGDRIMTIPLQQPGDVRRVTTETVLAPGVYPIELTLLGDRQRELDHLVTWLVATQGPATHRLRVAWVWSVRSPPLIRADGTTDPSVLADVKPGGRLDALAAALAVTTPIPTTLRIAPELAESWQRLASTVDPSLRTGAQELATAAAAPRNQVLAEPYVDVDRSAIVRSGLGDALTGPNGELVVGRTTLGATLGVRLDPSTAFVDSADATVVDQLTRAQSDRMLVRPSSLGPVDSASRFRTYAVPGSPIIAAQTDDDVLALLNGPQAPAARAQRALAALALIALQVPDDTRGVVLAPGDLPVSASVLRPFVAGLVQHPLLQPVRLEQWFDRVGLARDPDGEAVTRDLAPNDGAAAPVSAAHWRAANANLDDLRSLVGAGDPRVVRGERAMLVALAQGSDPAEVGAALDAIGSDAREFLSHISTPSRTVTLTARRSQIPLSFTNDTGRAVRVRVTLQSDKLLGSDGSTDISNLVDLPARPRNTTRLLGVQARTSGSFRVRVLLTTADRAIQGNTATITVNSTVFGAYGSWLTYGALAFLALWWAHHIWRTRRARSAPA